MICAWGIAAVAGAAPEPVRTVDEGSELPAGAVVHWILPKGSGVTLSGISRDGRWTAVSTFRGVFLWDASLRTTTEFSSLHLLKEFPPRDTRLGVAISPTDDSLVTIADKYVVRRFVDGAWRIVVERDSPFPDPWISAQTEFSPDGAFLAVTSQKSYFTVLRAESGEIAWKPAENYGSGFYTAFSPDGRYLTLATPGVPTVWEWSSKKPVPIMRTPSGPMLGKIAFAGHDGLVWTFGGNTYLYLHALPNGPPGALILPGYPWALCGSPEGGFLVYAQANRAIVRDLATDTDLVELPASPLRVDHVRCGVSGRRVLVGGREFATLWDLPEIVRRSLDEAERRRIANLDDDGLWKSLAGPTPQESFLAFWKLAEREGKVVDFLRRRFEIERGTAGELHERIDEIDSDDPLVRERAEARLNAAVWHDVPFFEKAYKATEWPVHAARLATVLGRLQPQAMGRISHPELRRAVRAVRLLEVVRTPEARRMVENLAASGALPVRNAARAVLVRWPVSPAEKP